MIRHSVPRYRPAAIVVIALTLWALAVWPGLATACAPAPEGTENMNQARVRAPEFPAGMEWLNTTAPLTMKDLRGKVVILDFWTYCCINCIHIMPDLKRLEAKYAGELVVVGVHSAKFTTEQATENIRQAVLRYELEHPVVNDNRMRIWNEYAVRAWPTLMLIDPEGYIVGYHSGEGIYDIFDEAVGKLVAEFDAKGQIKREPIAAISPESRRARSALLNFPGKLLADEGSARLFVADSNHNRIVVISLRDESILALIGSGAAGLQDGSFAEARFNKPQGLALDGDILYVADTENHAVRRVDLKHETVETIAGTGAQARAFNQSGPARTTALSSPWDLTLHAGTLYIANAGSHQLWRLDPGSMLLEPHAGSGRENRFDGPLPEAALAQPSGLATDGTWLYFADSEVSAIRAASIARDGEVKTIAGGELFEFGAQDGVGLRARFQHPLGVTLHEGKLYIADTYNNRIRIVDPADGRVGTFLGSGKAGMADGAARSASFDEPGGLSVAGGKLYIADTNNHLIRVADLKTGDVTTLMPRDMARLKPAALNEGPVTKLTEKVVHPGESTLRLELALPRGMKLNTLAPSAFTWRVGDGAAQSREGIGFPFDIPLGVIDGPTSVRIDYSIYYCDEGNEGLCYFRDGSLLLPLRVDSDAPALIRLPIEPEKR